MAKATIASLEERVRALEAELARLKERLEKAEKPKEDWLDKIYGSFADDPAAHEEAARLGRQWRESFRPKPAKKRKAAK